MAMSGEDKVHGSKRKIDKYIDRHIEKEDERVDDGHAENRLSQQPPTTI